ncbi:MAG: hypothetical protein KDJ52_35535 [Anaerolineae bacterium]|nr:hypothetical protein [Anaerolineae bacterium]
MCGNAKKGLTRYALYDMMLQAYKLGLKTMSKKLRQLIENQAKVKVVSKAHDNNDNTFVYPTLAFAFASFFYFYGYFFWDTIGRVLTGN